MAASDALPPCPGCSGERFVRASLFGARFRRDGADAESEAAVGLLMEEAEAQLAEAGEYLVFEEGGDTRVVALDRDWTRIGRSLAAEVRLDDPTISRRHALIVRGPDGLRVLDDRSLNGVFVNGERVEWTATRSSSGATACTSSRAPLRPAASPGRSSRRRAERFGRPRAARGGEG
jgi:hypothetical protein